MDDPFLKIIFVGACLFTIAVFFAPQYVQLRQLGKDNRIASSRRTLFSHAGLGAVIEGNLNNKNSFLTRAGRFESLLECHPRAPWTITFICSFMDLRAGTKFDIPTEHFASLVLDVEEETSATIPPDVIVQHGRLEGRITKIERNQGRIEIEITEPVPNTEGNVRMFLMSYGVEELVPTATYLRNTAAQETALIIDENLSMLLAGDK